MIEQIAKDKHRFVVNIGSGASRRRVTKTINGKYGKKELRDMYTKFEQEASKTPLSDITVGELIDSYIAHVESLGRKPTTIHGYKIALKRLSSSVKTISAKDCTVYHIEKEIASMSRKRLSSKSIKNTITILSAAFDHAIRIKQLETNPCKYAEIPKGKSRDIRILYKEEIQPFLNAISECDINEKVAYELALFMGLRRSELLGLKESDVDIVRGVISVHNTRHRVDGEDYDSTTKTVRSTRVLAMPDIVRMDIAILLATHKDFRYEKTDYLIQDGYGNPLGEQALTSRLTRLEKKHNLPHVTVHGLRHTYVSLLNEAGVDMARISREVGHGNLVTTQNIYTHILSDASNSSRGIAKVIDDTFLPKPLADGDEK